MTASPSEARAVAVEAARKAGALLRDRAQSIREIRHKGVVDLVTDVDLASEQLVRETILGAFPTHAILGEEGGLAGGEDSRFRWIVDPLDGTTNYAHGFPFYSVSIALEVEGTLAVGAVYDPALDELFVAERGQGATLNGEPIRVSGGIAQTDALLATGFPYDRAAFPRAMRAFEGMSLQTQAVRRAGSAALDLCYVACGRFEGYWEFIVRPWDVAAGILLVQEAGGRVTTVEGDPFPLDHPAILASNGELHEPFVRALAEIESAGPA